MASASKAGATRLLSEDLNAGQTIAGVLVENPLSEVAAKRADRGGPSAS